MEKCHPWLSCDINNISVEAAVSFWYGDFDFLHAKRFGLPRVCRECNVAVMKSQWRSPLIGWVVGLPFTHCLPADPDIRQPGAAADNGGGRRGSQGGAPTLTGAPINYQGTWYDL